jgi:archaellum component FlaC
MSTMIFEVYDALKEAGATEEKAKKAAEALAAYENRFNKVENDLNLLKWMVGFNVALSVGILLKLFG